MYEYMITQYIKTLTTTDIMKLANQKGVFLNDKEATILLNIAKEHWSTFYNGDPTTILNDLKNKINPLAYQTGVNFYYETMKKISTRLN